jgi:hypothetical protein
MPPVSGPLAGVPASRPMVEPPSQDACQRRAYGVPRKGLWSDRRNVLNVCAKCV